MRQSWVYIITNKNDTVLYTGVTSNLQKRIREHKEKSKPGFASRYNCTKLVFFAEFIAIEQAIEYEKKIKEGNRAKKEKLIHEMNPDWEDLARDWIL